MTAGPPSLLNSSGNGRQKQGAQDQIEQEPAPLQGVLSATIQGLAASNPKSMGKDAGPAFIVSIVQHLTTDNESLKLQLECRSRELRGAEQKNAEIHIEAARLDEKLKAANTNSRIGQLTGLIGGPLLGVSVDLYKNNANLAYLLGALAICVLVLPIAINIKRKQG